MADAKGKLLEYYKRSVQLKGNNNPDLVLKLIHLADIETHE